MTDAVEAPFYSGPVRWVQHARDGTLDGFSVVSWTGLLSGWVAEARKMGMNRQSLDSAAKPWLDWLDAVDRLAITDVRLTSPQDAADLLGFVVEPATKRDIELVISAEHTLEQLDEQNFYEPEFGYPYSLDRLRWRLRAERPIAQAPAHLPETEFSPDPGQAEAVEAAEGIVQIIAPAGSGKTTVLIERVRELRRRGVPEQAIFCLTFNRKARIELRERLLESGVGDAGAYTFHGFAWWVLFEARRLSRETRIGAVSLGQLRGFLGAARRAAAEHGVWIEPAEAQRRLSDIKLRLLLRPAEYAATIADDPDPVLHTMAALYSIYQETLRKQNRADFDDLILDAIRLLREDPGVRESWQTRCQHVLVDEYQDIEPAQELLVRLVAAPHDQLFCVGDEDQTLYAFRRASVERIICLDALYPGLQRVALGINYRCPPEVVAASKRLIDLNHVRFPKPIAPAPGADEGRISLHHATKQADTATEIAKLLKTRQRSEIAVLARTTNALRPIALACADLNVRIDGHDKLFRVLGARRALRDHLQLALHPEHATSRLVASVCRTPGRSLDRGREDAVAEQLRAGHSFEDAFADVEPPRRGRRDRPPLIAPGELFTELALTGTPSRQSRCCGSAADSTNGSRKTTASTASTNSSARYSNKPNKTPPASPHSNTSTTSNAKPHNSQPAATENTASNSPPSTAPKAANGPTSSSSPATKAPSPTPAHNKPAQTQSRAAKDSRQSAASATSPSPAPKHTSTSATTPNAPAASSKNPASSPPPTDPHAPHHRRLSRLAPPGQSAALLRGCAATEGPRSRRVGAPGLWTGRLQTRNAGPLSARAALPHPCPRRRGELDESAGCHTRQPRQGGSLWRASRRSTSTTYSSATASGSAFPATCPERAR
jgi:hypothetical protein